MRLLLADEQTYATAEEELSMTRTDIVTAARWTLGLDGRSASGRRLRAGLCDAAAVFWILRLAQIVGAL